MSDRANGKKTFRRTAALLLALLMLFTAGCRASSYMAVGMVRTNTKNSANLSFYSLKGKIVFTLKSSGEGDVTYTAKLESGTAKVYVEWAGSKTDLFTINGGEEVSSHGGYVESGQVTIIVETDGTCKNGEFHFNVK